MLIDLFAVAHGLFILPPIKKAMLSDLIGIYIIIIMLKCFHLNSMAGETYVRIKKSLAASPYLVNSGAVT